MSKFFYKMTCIIAFLLLHRIPALSTKFRPTMIGSNIFGPSKSSKLIKSVAITGASGLVGRELSNFLTDKGMQYRILI